MVPIRPQFFSFANACKCHNMMMKRWQWRGDTPRQGNYVKDLPTQNPIHFTDNEQPKTDRQWQSYGNLYNIISAKSLPTRTWDSFSIVSDASRIQVAGGGYLARWVASALFESNGVFRDLSIGNSFEVLEELFDPLLHVLKYIIRLSSMEVFFFFIREKQNRHRFVSNNFLAGRKP